MAAIGLRFLPNTVKGCGFCRIRSSPNTNNVNTHIKQRIPERTQHTQLPTKLLWNGADFRSIYTYWIARSLGPRDGMNAWQTQRRGHQTIGTGSCVFLPRSLSLALSLSFVPRMGSVCVPGRISMREEGVCDGGQRGGGAVGELELAEEVCHTINGRTKDSHSWKDANGCLVLLESYFGEKNSVQASGRSSRRLIFNRALWWLCHACYWSSPLPKESLITSQDDGRVHWASSMLTWHGARSDVLYVLIKQGANTRGSCSRVCM